MANAKQFIDWLQSDLTHFLSLVEEGSAAAGDPWQKGFSDHDMTIVVTESLANERQAVYNFFEQYPIGNECLVNIVLANEFAVGDTVNDLSLKFRAKTLVGIDVISSKAAPDRDTAVKLGTGGMYNLVGRLERRWVNLASWTNDYAQKKNYEIFKNFFVFYGAYHYGKTGRYPATRAEIASTIKDKGRANKLLEVTNNIAASDKLAQKVAIESALELIPKIIT